VGADRAHAQRVAVGLGAGELADPEVAAGAGLVLDQEALAQCHVQPLGDQARERVGVAARGEGDDDHHRLVRVAGGSVLGQRPRRER
jgi:hypothetical protein